MITGKSIAKGALVVMGATLLSRLLGFFREMVIAKYFGLSGDVDAYLVAFTVPSGVAMAVAAAISAGFIPVLNSYLVADERDNANKVANTLINAMVIILLAAVSVAMFQAPALVRVLAPGFSEESVLLAAEMSRYMLPALVFVSLMGVASGFLNSHQHFLLPALGPMITSIIIIGAVFVLSPVMGIRGLAAGTMAGFACQFLIQLPVMYRKGFRYKPELSIFHPGVARVFKLMTPVLVASMVPPFLLIVERGLASTLGTGSIAALNYAFRLMQLPLGLFLMAVAVPLFPALSALAARNELDRLKETMVKGVSVLALIMVPASAGLIALDVPIVRLLFERGAFGAKDTLPTAHTLAIYALALLPLAIRDIFRRGFYALQNTLTPVIVTVAALALNVALDLFLVKLIGIGGLALGAVVTAFTEALVLYALLSGRLNGLPVKPFLILLLKLAVASVVMGIAAYLCAGLIGARTDLATGAGRLIQVGGSVILGLIVYLLALIVLKVEEIREAARLARSLYSKAVHGMK